MKGVEHEGQEKKHASSHIEGLCIEEDQTTAYEDDDTNIMDGYTYDVVSKSTKYEEATNFPTYGDCGDIEERGYHLSLACSSLLTAIETP